MTNTEKIIAVALQYVGQREKPGNTFDETTPLGRMLKKAGQKKGESWCCYFAEGVFCEALPFAEEWFIKNFSANCGETYDNFVAAGITPRTSNPKPGDLVIFKYFKDGVEQSSGHAGICIHVPNVSCFIDIEGNTNDEGSRQGYEVAKMKRRYGKPNTGLRLKGFLTLHTDEILLP